MHLLEENKFPDIISWHSSSSTTITTSSLFNASPCRGEQQGDHPPSSTQLRGNKLSFNEFEDKDGFIILNKERFESEVMAQYFPGSKFSSFTRRLRRWNFQSSKVAGHKDARRYWHPFFRRGNFEAAAKILAVPQARGSTSSVILKDSLNRTTTTVVGNNNMFGEPLQIVGPPPVPSVAATDQPPKLNYLDAYQNHNNPSTPFTYHRDNENNNTNTSNSVVVASPHATSFPSNLPAISIPKFPSLSAPFDGNVGKDMHIYGNADTKHRCSSRYINNGIASPTTNHPECWNFHQDVNGYAPDHASTNYCDKNQNRNYFSRFNQHQNHSTAPSAHRSSHQGHADSRAETLYYDHNHLSMNISHRNQEHRHSEYTSAMPRSDDSTGDSIFQHDSGTYWHHQDKFYWANTYP